MTDVFVNILVAIVSGTTTIIISEMFRRKRDAIKEQKEKEEKALQIKKDLYDSIKRYVRTLPMISPRDILNKVDPNNKYQYISAEEVRSFIMSKYNVALYNEGNYSDIDYYKRLLKQLDESIRNYGKAREMFSDIYINSDDVLQNYISKEIVNLFLKVDNIARIAYEDGTIAYLDPSFDDVNKGNKFLEACDKLFLAINKDLEVQNNE